MEEVADDIQMSNEPHLLTLSEESRGAKMVSEELRVEIPSNASHETSREGNEDVSSDKSVEDIKIVSEEPRSEVPEETRPNQVESELAEAPTNHETTQLENLQRQNEELHKRLEDLMQYKWDSVRDLQPDPLTLQKILAHHDSVSSLLFDGGATEMDDDDDVKKAIINSPKVIFEEDEAKEEDEMKEVDQLLSKCHSDERINSHVCVNTKLQMIYLLIDS